MSVLKHWNTNAMPTYLCQRDWWWCVRLDAAPVILMLTNECWKPKYESHCSSNMAVLLQPAPPTVHTGTELQRVSYHVRLKRSLHAFVCSLSPCPPCYTAGCVFKLLCWSA